MVNYVLKSRSQLRSSEVWPYNERFDDDSSDVDFLTKHDAIANAYATSAFSSNHISSFVPKTTSTKARLQYKVMCILAITSESNNISYRVA